MDYTNKICSVCGAAFKEDDDIVVCPECATPHHRKCWFENGRCINSEKHAEGFIWAATVRPSAEVNNNQDETSYCAETVSVSESDAQARICHICSSENPADATHCGNCGAFFGETYEQPAEVVNCAYCGEENDARAQRCKRCGAPVFRIFRSDNPYLYATGMSPDEPVAGVTANEASLYTQSASKHYLKKFKKIDNKKFTFNWAAFFFTPYWFFYRKLYKAGIAALLTIVSVAMLAASIVTPALNSYEDYLKISTQISEAMEKEDRNVFTQEETDRLMQASGEYVKTAAAPLALYFLLLFLPKIICALIADKLYYNKMREDLEVISEAVPDNELKQIMILKRGKPSFMAFAAALLGEQLLITIFVSIADFISR